MNFTRGSGVDLVLATVACPPKPDISTEEATGSSRELLKLFAAATKAPGESGREDATAGAGESAERAWACRAAIIGEIEMSSSGRKDDNTGRDSSTFKEDNLVKKLPVSHLSEKGAITLADAFWERTSFLKGRPSETARCI